MATKEEQETLRLLVQQVSRAFYEPKYTIILDQLARHPVLKDDDLASRMGLQSKELNKLMAVLGTDRLVSTHRQNELKEGAQRSVLKQYYYIDYQHFCNVVKWRVAEMRRRIDTNLRNELDNRGYICPQCRKSYSAIEVDKVMDYERGLFICEDCGAELVDNEDADAVRGSQDRMQRFNKQMVFILEGLRKSEAMVLPAFDVAQWVRTHSSDADRRRADQSGGLKIAGAGGSGQAEDGIGVLLSMDKDEATRRQERDKEAEAKRAQNMLPDWIKKSTISGTLTASGVAESARANAAAAAQSLTASSNDEILRGLGTVGPGPSKIDAVREDTKMDVKPIVDRDSIDYDQYYASLAASATASTTGTPSGLGVSNGDEFGENDDDDDRKPSVEYLDSLNDYRKRSRSREDVGTPKSKIAKISESRDTHAHETRVNGDSNGNGHFHVPEVAEPVVDETKPVDDPIVYVNGVPKPFSKVTDDEHEDMTAEEYSAYYAILEAQESY